MNERNIEQKIIQAFGKGKTLTGSELQELTGLNELILWQTCRSSPRIYNRIAGWRFLRLDRAIQGYAKLTPSIKREFFTYTVVGLTKDRKKIDNRAAQIEADIKGISKKKFQFAKKEIGAIISSIDENGFFKDHVCCLMAGDIAYNMAHTVPRPEPSTGKMVRGSDLDIILVADATLSGEDLARLDQAIYERKHFLLVHPDYREELDYIVKNLDKVRSQIQFDTFESMVASKLLHEGKFLWGSRPLYKQIKALLKEAGVPKKLKEFERQAKKNRKEAEQYLLDNPAPYTEDEKLKHFYPKEEAEEIY